jgi:threonylcarbamoyladenosine tRNA methylthiotransferase MtaB
MELRKERAARLRAAGEAARRRFFAGRIGAAARVLVERSDDGAAAGHCEHFAPVRIAGAVEPGRIVTARITGATAEGLEARLAA